MLHFLWLSLCVFIDIVFGQFFFIFFLFDVHEGIQFFDVDLAAGEVDIGVELRIYH